MTSKPKAKRYFNWGLAIGYAIGAAFAAACFRIAWVIEPGRWWLNVAVCLFGYGFGWNVGMLLSPKGANEQREFMVYGRAITAFFGGFLIAKLDAAFGGNALKNVVADPVAVTRLLLFAIMFLFGVQSTYMGRRYSMWNSDQRWRLAQLRSATKFLAGRRVHRALPNRQRTLRRASAS